MTKRNIRFLATGFLVSGLLLTAFQTVSGTPADNRDTDTSEDREADRRILEEKAVQLELENEQLRAEYDRLVEMQGAESAEQSGDTYPVEDSETIEDSNEAGDNAEVEESNDVTEYTIVIAEGEPSSVIASQLEAYGLIDDFFVFNDYLEENNLIRRVRPGDYTVTSDMNRDQLIDAIIR